MMSNIHQEMAFYAIVLAVYVVGFLSYPVMMAIVESVRKR